MNTRRFPRTTLEAWPTRHPYCLEAPSKCMSLGDIALACVLGAGLGLMLAVWWSV